MNKKYKIGIFGSSAGDVETAAKKRVLKYKNLVYYI